MRYRSLASYVCQRRARHRARLRIRRSTTRSAVPRTARGTSSLPFPFLRGFGEAEFRFELFRKRVHRCADGERHSALHRGAFVGEEIERAPEKNSTFFVRRVRVGIGFEGGAIRAGGGDENRARHGVGHVLEHRLDSALRRALPCPCGRRLRFHPAAPFGAGEASGFFGVTLISLCAFSFATVSS